MPKPEGEMADLIVDGFETVQKEIARVSGDTVGRLNALEKEVHELSYKVGPVLRVFDNDLTTRIKMLESKVEGLEKDRDTANSRMWAVIGFTITSLLTAIASLLWHVLISRGN